MVCITTFNPNGHKPGQFALQLQNCMDKDIKIQYYNEIKQYIAEIPHHKKYNKIVNRFDQDQKVQDVWRSSHLPMDSHWKPGRTVIFKFRTVSGQLKKSGFDLMGH